VISSIVLASYFNYNYYQQNKEWSYFYEFNSVRGLINDNRNLDYYINNSDDSENIKAELFLIKSFHYPQNYDIKQLKILKEKISGSFKSFLINNLKNSISKYSFFLFFSLAFLIYFISKQKIWLYYVPLLFFILFY
ncbi:MAG TPA: hypothetical protein DDZ41_02690, partial [Flavobacterium sp.]|nr:hypothetical protein [Flavobacterium sp.]